MEGKKFSSSRSVVIYVRDVLERYGPDALRYYLCVNGPESSDTDFTWEQFVTRNNTELVAGWGNLVNRVMSLVNKNIGAIPEAGQLTDEDRAALQASAQAFETIGQLLEPQPAEGSDPGGDARRLRGQRLPVGDAALEAQGRPGAPGHRCCTSRCSSSATPRRCSPRSCRTARRRCSRCSAAKACGAASPSWCEVDDLDGGPSYPVLMGDYAAAQAVWESQPITPGVVIGEPVPLFTKLDPSVVDEELARLGADGEG